MLFITSWDDGHPLDIRLAELLAKHGFRGTFFVPMNNDRFGLPVLDASAMRELDRMAEVASHTRDHCYLNSVPPSEARRQIREGRIALEDVLGHPVPGFCYPGGKYAPVHRTMVAEAGFGYARTTRNLHLDTTPESSRDLFAIPTTLQFYPHRTGVYLRNWLRQGDWAARWPVARRGIGSRDLLRLLCWALDQAVHRDGSFHLWGHSWELDRFGGWELLDAFLEHAASVVPATARVTQRQALNL